MMKKLNIFVSVSTNNNDFQVELAESARATAERLGVAIQISYAQNDPIAQSQELLKVIQSPTSHPDAILFHPFGSTALPQVARAAVAAGIAVGVLNWRDDHVPGVTGKGVPGVICAPNHRKNWRLQAPPCTI